MSKTIEKGTRKFTLNNEEYTVSIFEYQGKTYTYMLDSERKPCEKCAVKDICNDIIDNDLMMLCGCEFCHEPWYVMNWETNE